MPALTASSESSDSDSQYRPTITPFPEYADDFPDTDTLDLDAWGRLHEVEKALTTLMDDDGWNDGDVHRAYAIDDPPRCPSCNRELWRRRRGQKIFLQLDRGSSRFRLDDGAPTITDGIDDWMNILKLSQS